MLSRRLQARPGAVIEIATAAGLAYAQHVLTHETNGELLRVLPGIYNDRPTDMAELVAQDESFWCFYPLHAAIREGLVRVAGEAEVPREKRNPTFRYGIPHPDTGQVETWWIIEGENRRPVDELTAEEQALPRKPGIWNHEALLAGIVEGWSPYEPYDVDHVDQVGAEIAHFLFFDGGDAAQSAAVALANEGYATDLRASEGGVTVVASANAIRDDLFDEEERISAIARTHGGTYEGRETRVG